MPNIVWSDMCPSESWSSYPSFLVDDYILSKKKKIFIRNDAYVGKLKTLNPVKGETQMAGEAAGSMINFSCSVRSIRLCEYVPGNGLFSWACAAFSQPPSSKLVNYICQGCTILKTALRLTVQAAVPVIQKPAKMLLIARH